jgi:PTS system ascorbate-specific IIA component
MITLSTPIPFGHTQNDPVDLVLAMGAVDKQTHVVALQELARMLMDETTLRQIRSAQDQRSLLAAIQPWAGRPRPDAAK